MRRRLKYAQVGAVSAAVIVLQLLQTRLFSVIYWNHLVYIIISIALLGFGMSGTLMALGRDTLLAKLLTVPRSALLFIATTILATLVIPRTSVSLGAIVAMPAVMRLLLTYVLTLPPYFFAGWILGQIFRDHADIIHKLYCADLVCAALGALVYVALIRPMGLVALTGVVCLLVALPCSFDEWSSRRRTWLVPFLAVAVISPLFLLRQPIEASIKSEPTKGIQREYVGRPDGRAVIELSEWNSISRIDVVASEKDPNHKRIFIDGDAWTEMVINPPRLPPPLSEPGLVGNSIGYRVRNTPPQSVLVIGVGGGIDVWTALRAGAKQIDAVEINPTTVNVIGQLYRRQNGDLLHRPGVQLYTEEGRSFVRRQVKKYDAITVHGVDTLAASSAGAYVLSENYLYTVEAFVDYISHLTSEGCLSITRWYILRRDGKPGPEAMRLFVVALEALHHLGVQDPRRHVIVGADPSPGWATILVKPTPFTSAERARHEGLAHPGYRVLYPGNATVPNEFQVYAEARAGGQQEDYLNHDPFDISPVTDDDPFFFHSEKYGTYWGSGDYRFHDLIRGNWPSFTLGLLMLAALVAVIVAIVLPLWIRPRIQRPVPRPPGFLWWLLYFSSLGLGFIFIEIALMQRFALLLGHPARSIAVVLATLLLSSGVGSYLGEKTKLRPPSFLLGVATAVLILAYAYPFVIGTLLALPLAAKVTATVALVFPVGLLLGMPFPAGIRRVAEWHNDAVPWMWGCNGGATVLGSILAIILAMSVGFTKVLALASALYLLAWVAMKRAGSQR